MCLSDNDGHIVIRDSVGHWPLDMVQNASKCPRPHWQGRTICLKPFFQLLACFYKVFTSKVENNVEPDQLASQDSHCFQNRI